MAVTRSARDDLIAGAPLESGVLVEDVVPVGLDGTEASRDDLVVDTHDGVLRDVLSKSVSQYISLLLLQKCSHLLWTYLDLIRLSILIRYVWILVVVVQQSAAIYWKVSKLLICMCFGMSLPENVLPQYAPSKSRLWPVSWIAKSMLLLVPKNAMLPLELYAQLSPGIVMTWRTCYCQ